MNENQVVLSLGKLDDIWCHWEEIGKNDKGQSRVKCVYCQNSQLRNATKCRHHLIVCGHTPLEVKQAMGQHVKKPYKTAGAQHAAAVTTVNGITFETLEPVEMTSLPRKKRSSSSMVLDRSKQQRMLDSNNRLDIEIKELTKKNLELEMEIKRQKFELEMETLREQRQMSKEKFELEIALLRQKLGVPELNILPN